MTERKSGLMLTLDRHFGSGYGSNEGKLNAIRAMVELGMISVGMPAHKLVDRDPFEEVEIVRDPQEATQRMMQGWKLLGTSSTEPWEFAMARPASVPRKEDVTNA